MADALKFWKWPGGRWIVVLGAGLGVGLFLQLVGPGDTAFYTAFIKALGAAFALMVFAGFCQQFWEGKKLKDAQGPGGVGGGFEEEAEVTLKTLNQRVTDQMETVNQRLARLEHEVLEEGAEGDEGNE